MSIASTQSSTLSFSSDTAEFYCNINCVVGKVKLSFDEIGKGIYQKSKPAFMENWKTLTSRPTAITHENFFVRTGKVSGITIIDIDRKNNKDGFAMLKSIGIEMKDYKDICASIRTPSGTRHYVFKYDARLATGANVYGLEGIDIRNDDGVVFAGKHYKVLSAPKQLGTIPDELLDKLTNNKKSSNKNEIKSKSNADLEKKYFDVIDEDNISDKYYDLCDLLEDKWFNDFDKWVKIGYALYNESSLDKDEALNTWLKLLSDRSYKFDLIECLRIWDRQGNTENKVNLGTIVNVVSQTNKDAYQQWKIDYSESTKKKKVITKQDTKILVLEEINSQLSTMDRNELYENNNIEFNDLLFKSKRTTIYYRRDCNINQSDFESCFE